MADEKTKETQLEGDLLDLGDFNDMFFDSLFQMFSDLIFGVFKLSVIPLSLFIVIRLGKAVLRGEIWFIDDYLFRRSFKKKAKISSKRFAELRKMINHYSHLRRRIMNCNCALDQKDTLRASINTILDILDFYEPHNKRLVTLGNFPEACRSVQAVLFKYEISVSLIEERFFDLLDQPFNQDHKVHIREISNEFVDILNLLGTELFETIKPFSDERDALIGSDIKGAKETIRFEKEVLDRSKGNYSTPQSSNPAYNNNENQVIFNSIIGNEITLKTV
ncbi:hypothetical protein ACFRGK_06470 [Bacillus subtilis]|uniref:hypothetical protein n=3 Tax=Bacillati TaxID=1783272 RepID=UPI002795BDDB|nr:hypothetical protein [Bacillus subtilis]